MKIRNVTERPSDDLVATHPGDRARITARSRSSFAVREPGTTRDVVVTLDEPTKKGELLDGAVALAQKKVWFILSDAFMVVEGRYVTSASWAKPRGKWSPLRSPFQWDPYAHDGMSLSAIGAPTDEGVFVYARSEAGASLVELRGTRFEPAKGVERGHASFDDRSLVVVSKKRRRAIFFDANGNEVDELVIGARALGSIKSLANVCAIQLRGRELWLHGYRGISMCIELDSDPPPLHVERTPRPAQKVVKIMPAGDYGAVAHPELFFKLAAPAVALELVRAWSLNETPDFASPAPYGAMLVGDNVLSFCKRVAREKLHRGFDFMAHLVQVAILRAPKEARAPKGVALVQLRTPSGLTQLLCREPFAALLQEHCDAARVRKKRR